MRKGPKKKNKNNNKQLIAQALVLSKKNLPSKHKKSKASQEEIKERRRLVMKFRLRGLTFRQIAKELGVGYMTVKRDLDAIKVETREKVSQFKHDYALGKSISTYEQIEEEAWEQASRCANGSSNKAQFLNLARTARNDQVKLLMDVGLIGRSATQVEHTVKADSVLDGWTKEAQQLVALAIIRSQIGNAEEPVPDNRKLIDVTAETINKENTDNGGNGESKEEIKIAASNTN